MKIIGLKEAVELYKSGKIKDPVILYYPNEGYVEVCRDEDCYGDAFESSCFLYGIETVSKDMLDDFRWGFWPSDEISEENLRKYIESYHEDVGGSDNEHQQQE